MKKLIVLSTIVFVSIMLMNCKKESNEKEILTFTVAGQIGETSINSQDETVLVVVGLDISLAAIVPTITISDKASITPSSGTMTDFSSGPVIYSVAAEDGSKKQWSVTVTHELRSGADIVSFSFDSLQIGDAIIDAGTHSVSVTLKTGTNLNSLSPQIGVSDGAAISPASGEAVDFTSDSVLYTVTAENGTQQNWYVKVAIELSSERKILSITVPNQVGDELRLGGSIFLEVPLATDLTSIAPTIELSPGATLEPASGVPQDFSVNGYISYKATAENGNSSTYKIFVGYPSFKADNPKIQYVGRIDFTNPQIPRFWMSGVYITAKFSGTYCDIIINDPYQNYVEIVVDNSTYYRFKVDAGISTLKQVTGLSAGEHTVVFCKNTETGKGYMEFLGLRCDSLLTPDPLPSLKMDIIGNSITCGTGSDQSLTACGMGAWEAQHNAYMSYGPAVARKLNAQWHISAYSGIGLIHSCCGITFNMPQVYNKINLMPSGADYNLSEYIPDVVTICLGQNDGIMDSTTFCSAYVDFVETLRGYYPDAQIVLLTSPMADDALVAVMKNYLTGIVNHINNGGDNKVYKYYFSQRYHSGCDSHPSLAEHELMAQELETFINGILP